MQAIWNVPQTFVLVANQTIEQLEHRGHRNSLTNLAKVSPLMMRPNNVEDAMKSLNSLKFSIWGWHPHFNYIDHFGMCCFNRFQILFEMVSIHHLQMADQMLHHHPQSTLDFNPKSKQDQTPKWPGLLSPFPRVFARRLWWGDTSHLSRRVGGPPSHETTGLAVQNIFRRRGLSLWVSNNSGLTFFVELAILASAKYQGELCQKL